MSGKFKQYFIFFAFFLLASIIFLFSSNYISGNTSVTPALNPLDTFTIQANTSTSNNGGSANWAIFFDLIAGSRDVTVTQMSTANTGTASASFSVEVYTRTGTALGGPVSSGPGSSSTGWTLIGTAPAIQGPSNNGVSLVFTIPPILVTANDTVGVAVKFIGVGPRYYGSGSPPYSVYSDTNLTLVTGDGRSAPFTPTGSFFASRALNGVIRYVVNLVSSVGTISTLTPNGYRLEQNYPNPFNPQTTIEFAIPEKSNVVLKIFNTQGQEVAVLANEEYLPGIHSVRWNATGLSSGIYFYSIKAGKFSQTKKMLFVK